MHTVCWNHSYPARENQQGKDTAMTKHCLHGPGAGARALEQKQKPNKTQNLKEKIMHTPSPQLQLLKTESCLQAGLECHTQWRKTLNF